MDIILSKRMTIWLSHAEEFRCNDFIMIRERPCRITGIISTREGICCSAFDVFHPTRRLDIWIEGRDTMVTVPHIDIRQVILVGESNLDLVAPVTNPIMLAEIRKAWHTGQVSVEFVTWGTTECMVQGFSVSK